MKRLFAVSLAILLPASFALAASQNPALIDVLTGKNHPAPAQLTLDSYVNWATPILKPSAKSDFVSAFTPLIFEWYESEKGRDLPSEVLKDKDNIFVNVQRPLQQTIDMEDAGEIEEGTTVGAEVYALMDGSPSEVLETMLYRWGKPVGKTEGQTYPPGGPFARRVEYFAPNPEWGEQAYASLSLRRDGGIVKDLADRYMMIIRGNENDGYDVFMQYFKDGGGTPSTKCFAIAMIRPVSGGKTSYRISTRYQGQSYKILGNVSIGRKNIGFNVDKVRGIQLEFRDALAELKKTGSIKDHKTDIEFGGK